MKKIIALCLTLALLMTTGTVALAKNDSQDKTAKAAKTTLQEKSTYEFEYQLPKYILAQKDTKIPVTFKTDNLGKAGYEGVHFEIAATYKDEGKATVKFSAKDSANKTYTFVNSGSWGPADGFTLPASYNKTTEWTLNFSKAGKYALSFKAMDKNDKKIAEVKKEVTVTGSAFVYTVPSRILSDKEVTVKVGFVSAESYSDVHFEFEKTAGPGDIQFKATDSDNNVFVFTNSGTWGEDFDIDEDYNETTPWKLTFTEPGTYTIAFKLVDDEGDVLVLGKQSLAVKDSSEDEDDEDEDEDDKDNNKKGKTHGLLNALRNHLKNRGRGNSQARVNSTVRLLELLEDRGLDLAEIAESIKELEEALKDYKEMTKEEYKVLGKMHQFCGRLRQTYINGKKIQFDVPPVVKEDRTLVPFRKIAEELGAKVSWDEKKQKITVTKDDTTVEIFVGQVNAVINEDGTKKKVTLDVPAQIYQSRTLVPLRFLAEAFDAEVDYYPEGAMIVINKKAL